MTLRAVTLLTLSALTGAGATLALPGAPPARLVSASISIDGEIVLKASTSDDGHADVDEVWDYLTNQLVFEPTPAFGALGIDPEADRHTFGWLKGEQTAHLGDPPQLGLDVRYGGSDAPFLLTLLRAEDGRGWRVAPETIEKRFRYRKISRREASLLKQPKRER